MTARDVATKVHEWFFRGAALREARAGVSAWDERRAVATRQAKLLLEVARRVAETAHALPSGAWAPVVLAMYRDAIYWALAARRPPGVELQSDLRGLWDASNRQMISPSPPDNEDSAALRRTLFDDYDPRSLAVTDDDVARARTFAEALIRDVEAPRRRVVRVVGQRWLRVGLVGVALLSIAVGVRATALGPNLAQGKPFRLSAPWPGWPDCVANNGCNRLMFQTAEGDEPWVEIDLGAPKNIRRVEVINRDNCCADRAVPLIVELSSDGTSWTQVARRDAEFGSWTAKWAPKTCRYVRLKVLKRTTLHLQSVVVR